MSILRLSVIIISSTHNRIVKHFYRLLNAKAVNNLHMEYCIIMWYIRTLMIDALTHLESMITTSDIITEDQYEETHHMTIG